MRPNRSAARPSRMISAICSHALRFNRPAHSGIRQQNTALTRQRCPPMVKSLRPSQGLHHRCDFQSIAQRGGKRLVHIRDHRRRSAPSRVLAVSVKACGQLMRASSIVFMKAPLPTLTSRTSASGLAASFLRQDRCCDQVQTFDRRSHVHAPHKAACPPVRFDPSHLRWPRRFHARSAPRRSCPICVRDTRYRLKLVLCPTSVAQASARNHWNICPAFRQCRGKN